MFSILIALPVLVIYGSDELSSFCLTLYYYVVYITIKGME